MQAFVEEQIGAGGDGLPGGELTGVEAGAETSVVLRGLFWAVQVVALLSAAGFAVGAEQLFELVEQVGFWAEVEKFSPAARALAMASFIGIRS